MNINKSLAAPDSPDDAKNDATYFPTQAANAPVAAPRPNPYAITVDVTPPELSLPDGRKQFYVLSEEITQPTKRPKKGEPSLIVAFDTEYKTPEYALTRDEIKDGKGNYRVLSYQFDAMLPDGTRWQGICCPRDDERMTLEDFMIFVLGSAARDRGLKRLPSRIYLIGHFTRADIPAFSDFKDVSRFLSCIRNTFASADSYIPLSVRTLDGAKIPLRLHVRDTFLLTPATSKSLREIGKLVNCQKIDLPDAVISNMDVLRCDDWGTFRKYALRDAEICLKYALDVQQLCAEVTGKEKIPVTLPSIGVDRLWKSWEEQGLDPLDVLGQEKHLNKYFDKDRGFMRAKEKNVPLEEVSWWIDFVTQTYHGGRNEQFWFGPSFLDDWTDYDLSSAYPTAMSLIGLPQWRNIAISHDANDFQPTTLGFAVVDFKFPRNIRYPTLPVRTAHGLVFPLSGRSACAAPEIYLAKQLGAEIKIVMGIVVPSDPDKRVFADFSMHCINERIKAGKNTLKGLVWKEIGNSTYGKTAQGLREKRVYDMRDRSTKPLPPSRITNCFFASFITSFVRASLGEIMNALPDTRCVFSCTTDGFLTNATSEEIAAAQTGPVCTIFAAARKELTGSDTVLEIKHQARRLLGWRTRGQATLQPGMSEGVDEDFNYVLAKGGIYTRSELDSYRLQNEDITRMFFNRTPETILQVKAKTGVRDMIDYDADLVEKLIEKRLNMEFDWKRCPARAWESKTYNHLVFSTTPWQSVAQFNEIRARWNEFTASKRTCLKTLDDYHEFAAFIESRSLPKEHAKYMRKDSGDVRRLRALLCSAWKHECAGLSWRLGDLSAAEFAEKLSFHGIPCKKSDVENGKKKPFLANSCPRTKRTVDLLIRLKEKPFPTLEVEQFLFAGPSEGGLDLRSNDTCQFVERCD